jgi:hypothetical protein
VDAITGHARKSVADGYGEYPMAALRRELMKIPYITVAEPKPLDDGDSRQVAVA